jgi:hypothetical protein
LGIPVHFPPSITISQNLSAALSLFARALITIDEIDQ